MDLIIVLAQILGIILTVVGISVVINKNNVSRAIDELTRNQGFLWFFGFIAVVIGAVLIALNNIWNSGLLKLFVTIVGWLSLVKGAFILIFPSSAGSFYKKCNKASTLYFGGLVAFVVGLLLLYRGFM